MVVQVLVWICEKWAVVVVPSIGLRLHKEIQIDEDRWIVCIKVLHAPKYNRVRSERVQCLHSRLKISEYSDHKHNHDRNISWTEPLQGKPTILLQCFLAELIMVLRGGFSELVKIRQECIFIKSFSHLVRQLIVADGHVVAMNVSNRIDIKTRIDAIEPLWPLTRGRRAIRK